jgi:UDP-N-acetyl-D-mannosaminuronic acid dehydrogenase
MKEFDVVVVGLGYIGLPTSSLIANTGLKVLGVDISNEVIASVNSGKVHFKEPGLENELKKAVDSGFLVASTSVSRANVFVIVVPTPFIGETFEPDISYVVNATKSVIPFLEEGDLFILESTSPVGTTDYLSELIFNERPDLKNKIHIAYCPERILPGNALQELVNNDRIVGGIDNKSSTVALEFYKKFVLGDVYKTNSKTAELCKLTENSSRDVQIAFANELSMICEKAEIDVYELIELANKHPRVNILRPGAGVGGHCIAVDPYFIVNGFKNEAKLIAQARSVNNFKHEWCTLKIKEAIKNFIRLNNKVPKVALMGLAFKPNIDDLRESPSIKIVSEIISIENLDFYVVEPNVHSHKTFILTDYIFAFESADIVAFLVNHKEFEQLRVKDSNKIILDFVGVFSSKNVIN